MNDQSSAEDASPGSGVRQEAKPAPSTPNQRLKKKVVFCPLGHRAKPGECTAKRCKQAKAEDFPALELVAPVPGEARQGASVVLNLDVLEKAAPEDAAFLARKALARMPEGLEGTEATQWSQAKMVELLPEAVADVQWDLRYGSDRQRKEARETVLRANGMDKKDSNNAGQQGLIILQLGGGDMQIPWLSRLQPTKKDAADASPMPAVVDSKP